VTVEDRLRATAEALTGTMREVRPLTLPPERPGRVSRPRVPRRWPGWVAPLTAAVAVIAVAVALAAVRDSRDATPAPSVPVVHPLPADAIPRYYVQLGGAPGAGQQRVAIVGDSRTGKVLATVKPPPADLTFESVTGAADDRTFVLDAISITGAAGDSPEGTHSWYLLRLAPGTGHPATLTKLPVVGPADSSQISGLAVSPDGGTLAILYQNDAGARSGKSFVLRTLSVSTGKVLRTWTAGGKTEDFWIDPNPGNSAGLTWTADGRTLAFKFPANTWPDYERTLNVDGKGSSLLADSQSVFADPGNRDNCSTLLLSSDGRTMVCGTVGNATDGCRAQEPVFDLYSTATGKLARELYRYRGSCQAGDANVVWTGAGGTAIGFIQTDSSTGKVGYRFGLLRSGKFTPLHVFMPVGYASYPGALAF
jgi:hypothetical protein